MKFDNYYILCTDQKKKKIQKKYKKKKIQKKKNTKQLYKSLVDII